MLTRDLVSARRHHRLVAPSIRSVSHGSGQAHEYGVWEGVKLHCSMEHHVYRAETVSRLRDWGQGASRGSIGRLQTRSEQ